MATKIQILQIWQTTEVIEIPRAIKLNSNWLRLRFKDRVGIIPHLRQYRTKSVWRLCTPSACKFPFRACFVSSRTHLACIFSEIFRENTRKSTKDFLRFSLHLSKNLTTQSACVRYETDSHISQKCSWIHQVFTPLFVSSDEKFDDASVAQSLCGIAIEKGTSGKLLRSAFLFDILPKIWYN